MDTIQIGEYRLSSDDFFDKKIININNKEYSLTNPETWYMLHKYYINLLINIIDYLPAFFNENECEEIMNKILPSWKKSSEFNKKLGIASNVNRILC